MYVLPALCDMTGTGTMYAGLCLSYASVFQMLRGSTIIFTAVLSCIFLGRKQPLFQWVSIAIVMLGIAVVGVASVLSKPATTNKDESSVLIGDLLIIVAQFLVACQMVMEEKLMSVYHTPVLKVVGLEGVFGFIILGALMMPMYHLHIQGYPFENAPDAISQLRENATIDYAMLGNILSIPFFNAFGNSVTKHLSASHRMVVDSLRTGIVWTVSLALGWEPFSWIQVIGFLIIIFGSAMYNEVITFSCFVYPEKEAAPEDSSQPEKDSNNIPTEGAVAAQRIAAGGRGDQLLSNGSV